MLETLAHAMEIGQIKINSVKKGDTMNTLVSVFQRRIVPAVVVLTLFAAVASAQSTSIWLEAECASVGSLWNKPADANASNSSYVVIQPGNNSASSAPTNSAGYINFAYSVSQSEYRCNIVDMGSIHQYIQSERRKPYTDVCVL